MSDVDPQFPRYRIPETTIDGPRKTDGELEFRLWCTVEHVPADDYLADGIPIVLQVFDFSGPMGAPDRLPKELLEECAQAISQLIFRHSMEAVEDPSPLELATAVLEAVGARMELVALAVHALNMENVCRAGDELDQASLAFPYAPGVIAARDRWREVRARYGRPKPAEGT